MSSRPTTAIVDPIAIRIDGALVTVPSGTTVAAAMAWAKQTRFRRSVGGEARAALCGMGVCFECRVSINGVAHVRSCTTLVASGMEVCTND